MKIRTLLLALIIIFVAGSALYSDEVPPESGFPEAEAARESGTLHNLGASLLISSAADEIDSLVADLSSATAEDFPEGALGAEYMWITKPDGLNGHGYAGFGGFSLYYAPQEGNFLARFIGSPDFGRLRNDTGAYLADLDAGSSPLPGLSFQYRGGWGYLLNFGSIIHLYIGGGIGVGAGFSDYNAGLAVYGVAVTNFSLTLGGFGLYAGLTVDAGYDLMNATVEYFRNNGDILGALSDSGNLRINLVPSIGLTFAF